MKKLGLIFVVFLCFSLFLVPNKSSAATCPAGTTYDTMAEECITKCKTGQYYSYNTKKCATDTCPKGEHMSASPWGDADKCVKNLTASEEAAITAAISKAVAADAAAKAAAANTGAVDPKNNQDGCSDANVGTTCKDAYGKDGKCSFNKSSKYYYCARDGAIVCPDGQMWVNNKCESDSDAWKATEAAIAKETANASQKPGGTVEGGGASSCSVGVFGVFSWAGWNCILTNIIKIFFLNIAGFFLWLSANMINYAIQVGILDFSKWAPDALYPIWIVVRQIVSLFVVFAGLWLGLMYIIGKDETFEKYIPWVVIFALFVNFSYPLVRTAVDVSNVVSLNIYASAVGNDALAGTGNNTAGALIMSRLGLNNLVMSATETEVDNKTKNGEATSIDVLTSINTVPGALMAIIFVLYAAYIFFMVTALIIMRTVALVFLIIASPILFIDSVIPKLGDEAVKLRKIFFEQLAVGPVFMIMLALTLKFIGIFSGVAKSGGGGASQTVVEFFNIAMMLIMLHIMLKITKETAGGIGQMATNAMGKVGGFAGGAALGLATGGAGLLARGTMGRAAGALRDSKWMQNNQGGAIGRHMYNMTDSVAKSSFDARNSSFVQTGARKLGLSGGMGAGNKMGYEEIAEQKAKNITAHLGRIGTHKNNVYDAEGKMVARKGDVNTTDPEAINARSEYIKNAGGAMFATKQEKDDIKYKLQETAGEAKTLEQETISKYKNTTDSEEREKLFKKQTSETQEKMLDQDMKSAKKEDKVFDKEKEKQEIAKSQIASTQKLAESNEQLADALRTQKSTSSSTPTEPDRSPSAFSESKGTIELEPKTAAPSTNKTKGILAEAGF